MVYCISETITVPEGMVVKNITVTTNDQVYVCSDPETMYCKDIYLFIHCPLGATVVRQDEIISVEIKFE